MPPLPGTEFALPATTFQLFDEACVLSRIKSEKTMKIAVALPVLVVYGAILSLAALEAVNSDYALTNTFLYDSSFVKAPPPPSTWRFLVNIFSVIPNAYVLWITEHFKENNRVSIWVQVLWSINFILWGFVISTPWLHVDDGVVLGGKWAFVWLSTILNFPILYYHATTPHHPKFRFTPTARFWMSYHITTGVVEWICSIVALLPNTHPDVKRVAVTAMALVALFGHGTSSFHQSNRVQGSRLVMAATYRLFIHFHCFCASQLLMRPHSDLWLANTVIIFNTYVWVRVWGFICYRLDIYKESKYTAYVTLAGMTTATPVFGAFAPILMVGSVAWGVAVVKYILVSSPQEFKNLARERKRESIANLHLLQMIGKLKKVHGDQQRPSMRRDSEVFSDARAFFDLFAEPQDDDPTSQPVLKGQDIETLMGAGELPKEALDYIENGVPYDVFFMCVWPDEKVKLNCRTALACHSNLSDRGKAQYVFDLLVASGKKHTDSNLYIGKAELALLLGEWNVTSEDAHFLFNKANKKTDGRIYFDEFFSGMEDVWRFVFDEAVHDIAQDVCPCEDHAGTATLQTKIKTE